MHLAEWLKLKWLTKPNVDKDVDQMEFWYITCWLEYKSFQLLWKTGSFCES